MPYHGLESDNLVYLLELSDEHNSINFCKQNYQEIQAGSVEKVEVLQPQHYTDILLR